MTIEKIEAKFFFAVVKKLLDFFPELKEEDFLLLFIHNINGGLRYVKRNKRLD